MKKKHLFIILLLLANVFSAMAESVTVTIVVDDASRVIVTRSGDRGPGSGEVVVLQDGRNSCILNTEDCYPLTIQQKDGVGILKKVVKNGSQDLPISSGACRFLIDGNSMIEITTEAVTPPKDPAFRFSIAEPSQVIIKANDQVVSDLNAPLSIAVEGKLEAIAAEGYAITKMTVGAREVSPYKGTYIYYAREDDKDQTREVVVETQPLVTFDLDFNGRIKLLNNENDAVIDITSLSVPVAKGTALKIVPSDPKYTLKSVTINGVDKQVSGNVCNFGVNVPTTVIVKTESSSPAVKFVVDDPSKVKVYLAGSDKALDLSKIEEYEKNTQLIIEPSSEEFRIASVMANNFKLEPLKNGTYMVGVAVDLVLDIKTKRNVPTFTFKVDAPERIKVLKEKVELNFAEPIELAKGDSIVIEPASADFRIKSVVANNQALTAKDNKYYVKVNGDVDFDIQTAASLVVHFAQITGGTMTASRNGVVLKEGDKVNTGEELILENTPDEGYLFTNYYVNGEECSRKYIVKGSDDLTFIALFRTVKEGYSFVKFDFDTDAMSVRNKKTGELLDTTNPCEIEQGNELSIYLIASGRFFKHFSVNGTEIAPDEDNEKSYTVAINSPKIDIKAVTYQKVSVSSDITTYPEEKGNPLSLATLGKVLIKYNGETGSNFLLSEGDEIELVPVVLRDGFEFGYIYKNYDPENGKIEGQRYTILEEDLEGETPVLVFKGTFTLIIPDGIESIDAVQSYYDASTMQIVTGGGNTKVYTASGEMVIDSNETNISVSRLESGVYVVKSQDKVFKVIKK